MQLPLDSNIHHVFQISLLKKSVDNHSVSGTLPPVREKGEFCMLPLKVLDKRMLKKRNRLVAEVLVQWTNVEPEDSTWEDVEELQQK